MQMKAEGGRERDAEKHTQRHRERHIQREEVTSYLIDNNTSDICVTELL